MRISADTIADAAVRIAGDIAHQEVRLLAALAGGPRQGAAILRHMGISSDSFEQEDLLGIYLALQWAGDARNGVPPKNTLAIARLCRWLLRQIGHWDEREHRPFVSGSIWGPEPLGTLLLGVPFDPALLAREAAALVDLHRRREELAERIRGAA